MGISIARKNPYGGSIVLESVNSYMNKIGKDCVKSNKLTS